MKIATSAVALTGVALFTAAPALAATAYMDGLFNVGPGWSTITMPDGSQCAAGCTEIRYDYITQSSAERAAARWMDANNDPGAVLYAYSLGSVGVIRAREDRPDWQGKVVLLGSPAKPGNGNTAAQGGSPALDVQGGQIEFVSVESDSVAFPGRPGASFIDHIYDYRDRDFSAETPVKVSQPTEAVVDREYTEEPAVDEAVEAEPELNWYQRAKLRAEERREARAERWAAYRERRAERRAESRARWDTFVAKLRGDEPDAGASTPDEADSAASGAQGGDSGTDGGDE